MKYTAPEMEIVMFEAEEVIVASGDEVNTQEEGEYMPGETL